jgi:hypothetical protein
LFVNDLTDNARLPDLPAPRFLLEHGQELDSDRGALAVDASACSGRRVRRCPVLRMASRLM